jgi:hypothetical protein
LRHPPKNAWKPSPLPARTEAALDQQAATDLTAFTAQVAALADTAIPPGCRADLLAVAAALQAQ